MWDQDDAILMWCINTTAQQLGRAGTQPRAWDVKGTPAPGSAPWPHAPW